MSTANPTLEASKALVAATNKLKRVETKAEKSIERAVASATKRNATKLAEATKAVVDAKIALTATLQ